MHDRATTHDEFCSPDRNVISDRHMGACLGGNVYKKLSATLLVTASEVQRTPCTTVG